MGMPRRARAVTPVSPPSQSTGPGGQMQSGRRQEELSLGILYTSVNAGERRHYLTKTRQAKTWE